jgi:hypothetical protein
VTTASPDSRPIRAKRRLGVSLLVRRKIRATARGVPDLNAGQAGRDRGAVTTASRPGPFQSLGDRIRSSPISEDAVWGLWGLPELGVVQGPCVLEDGQLRPLPNVRGAATVGRGAQPTGTPPGMSLRPGTARREVRRGRRGWRGTGGRRSGQTGRLCVPERKGGHSTACPLSPIFGNAILDYLWRGRLVAVDRPICSFASSRP